MSGGTTLSALPQVLASGKDEADSMTLRNALDDAYDSARRADVPIYTLDPRGGASPEDSVRGGMSVTSHYNSYATPEQLAANIKTQQSYMSEVAINTGGRAFINASNLKKAVQDIVGENGSYYLLSYSPDPIVHDGKYHEIDVKVTRPGLIVRPRKGYVAAASGPATTDAKPTLDKAMSAGVNVSGISLRAFAAPIAGTAKGMNAVVTVEVTYPAPVDGSRKIDDQLQMTLLAMDPDAQVKAQSSQAFHFAGTVPQGQTAVTFLVNDVVVLPSQPLTMRVGMSSQALGKAGTVQFSVDVAKPSDSKLQLSGLLIGFTGAPREAAMRTDVIKDLVPFQPTTVRTFSATDSLRVFGRTFWGTKDAAADVTLTIEGSTIAPQVLHLIASSGSASHRESVIDSPLPLAGLAAGSYVLHIDVRLPSGQTARRDVPFAVK